MPSQNLVDVNLEKIFGETLKSTSEMYVVNAGEQPLSTLLNTLDTAESPPTVRILSPEGPLKHIKDEFLFASTAADLIDDGVLEIRVNEDPQINSLLVTGQEVISLVTATDTVAGLRTDEQRYAAETKAYYDDLWNSAGEFSFRTPPLSRVRSTLETEIGPEVRKDFDRVIEATQPQNGQAVDLDEVSVCLLVGAKNQELLSDISKWGEDVGLASKATFSRAKTQLEEKGLIDTENVPIDIGRPRMRLLVGDQRLESAEPPEMVTVANEIIAN